MKEGDERHRDALRLLKAIGLRELHGDGNVRRLAELAADERFSLRLDMEEAAHRCREWMLSEPAALSRAWRRLREGVYGLQVSVKLQVQETGRLVGSWGDEVQAALGPVLWPAGAQPQRVALGEGDDLEARSAMASIGSGDSKVGCDVCLFARKDRTVAVELRITPIGSSPGVGWSAELWRASEPLQRMPIEDGRVAFTRALSPGAYRIVIRAGREQYEVEVEVA